MMDILIIGGGAQGRLICELVNNFYKSWTVVSAEHHTDIADDIIDGIVAIGDISARRKAVEYVLEKIPNFKFKTVRCPSALIGDNVKIGKGTMIMPGAVINNGAVIGEHCLINSGVIVEHDNVIGDFVNLQPGVVTGGYVEVGDGTCVGLGAMIRDRVKIGSGATIGMGSVVLRNVNNNETAWGNPAKTI